MIKLKDILLESKTYSDYPESAKNNAKKAIGWKEKYGRDEVSAGTRVGWARAHQLAGGEAISADTVKRMSAFNRHRKNSKIDSKYKDTPWKDNGYVAWLIWGGDSGVDWAMKKSKKMLSEGMNKDAIIDIVNKVYPKIVKDLGGKTLKVEVHNNIWNRVGAVGAEELMEDDNPAAEYDWDKKKIYVYYAGAKNIQEVIKSLLQNKKKFDDGYAKGYNYKTHPFEKAATRAESKWKNYLKYI